MPNNLRLGIVISAIALSAFKCSRTQEAFLTVQVCLVDEAQRSPFAEVMREVARSQNLRFVDNSLNTSRRLAEVRDKGMVDLDHLPTINMGIEGENGLGVTAGNLGLPPNQVALGFTAGSDGNKAQELAHQLIRALSQRYRVEIVPNGKGVFPMRSCGKGAV